jgi:hypothetical protein
MRWITMGNFPPPYTGNIHEDRSEALGLIGRAHDAERAGKYKDACDLHTRAANLLFQTIQYGSKKSVKRRLDKLCLRASKERMELLRNAASAARKDCVVLGRTIFILNVKY